MRLEAGQKNFLSQAAWGTLKTRSQKLRVAAVSFASSSSRDFMSAKELRTESTDIIPITDATPGQRQQKQQTDQIVNKPQTPALVDDKTNSTAVQPQIQIQRRTSMGFSTLKPKTDSHRQKVKKMRCERSVHISVGTFFVLVGTFIAVVLPLQLSREHCQQPGWQEFCLLSATPLFTASTCPCTILDYKCNADVELGWEHPEVLFECQANASDYDFKSYSPTTIRFCDSNQDCNSFSYCNANGRCNGCTQCAKVRVRHARVCGDFF